MTNTPALGLLLDIDGPIASPVSRSIAIPSILSDLLTLVAGGVPIAFITGRSADFVLEEVVAPLRAAGLDSALQDGGRMFVVCEKGAVWFALGADGPGEIEVDRTVALPGEFRDHIRSMVGKRYADSMFFDEGKLAMVSVEQLTTLTMAEYQPLQLEYNDVAFDALVERGLGVRYGDREVPDAAGEVPFRIDPTIISSDVESVLLDKDRGAERALAHFESQGGLPDLWRSVGDSRSDYKMADYLYAAGYDVAHVDVRPADGVLEKPYPVVIEGDLIHDEAGAAFLSYWVKKLGL
ncbi:hypothetical protein [Subtercola boreus]|uniref:Haloacid dehalogenase n=1 Tax=Subtercola boreus TaxID=120213 RepID=A0A3E0W7Z5_9MICO|nr:hypothetical protein [Subtercola boreus]RFA18024.1 hypothetical protein B7R24_15320 [Subtercola boreus]RFA18406.1 hypothetical protein B7R23_15355 [Subtercola boreus]RFA24935.1 hypothetical protein B7R25_15350 [Subtercola boreus]